MDSVGYWFHSVDVGQDTVTPGQKPAEILDAEWQQMRLPPLAGKTVLDIGAWDGFFSFRSEAPAPPASSRSTTTRGRWTSACGT